MQYICGRPEYDGGASGAPGTGDWGIDDEMGERAGRFQRH